VATLDSPEGARALISRRVSVLPLSVAFPVLHRANTLHPYPRRAGAPRLAMVIAAAMAIAWINSGFFLIVSRQKDPPRGATTFHRSVGVRDASRFTNSPPPSLLTRCLSLRGFPFVFPLSPRHAAKVSRTLQRGPLLSSLGRTRCCSSYRDCRKGVRESANRTEARR